jgi:hypothetical protein
MLAYMRPRQLFCLAFSLGALACGKGEECTKARLAASDSWKNIVDQAGQAKLKGWLGFDDLPEPKKAEHVKTFTEIETQADMVFKSFAFEKITWKTSDPAREETNRTFNTYFARDNFSLMAASLKTANEKYDSTSKFCRD